MKGDLISFFCVIDRDTHADFESGCKLIEAIPSQCGSGYITKGVELILSVPCFEFWLLCHFLKTRMPFIRTQQKSPCDNVIDELRKIPSFKDYDRKSKGIFEGQWNELVGHYEKAVSNAEYTLSEYEKEGEINPSTNVHHLTEYLQGRRRAD